MADGDGVHVVDHSIRVCHCAGMYKVVIVRVWAALRILLIPPHFFELLTWNESCSGIPRFKHVTEISRWRNLFDDPILVGERAYLG